MIALAALAGGLSGRLELVPVLYLGLRLGEGTGALAALPLLRAAVLTCAETAALTRAQILVQSGTTVLSIANQNPQNVLALLR